MHGIKVDLDAQAALLREMVAPFEPEYRGNAAFIEGQAKGYGPGFGYLEAQCLHGVLRSLKPARMVEVGSGVSTHCASIAFEMNAREGRPGKITCVEPFPSKYLRESGKIELIEQKVQEVDPGVFERLESGDLLFIDSSHAVKPGGDVPVIYLDILPRLTPGVVVQIHDIYFPYLYQRDILDSLYQWSETSMLATLLTNNPRLEIMFSQSMLHYDAPDVLKSVFPEYRRASDENGLADRSVQGHFPASIYLVAS